MTQSRQAPPTPPGTPTEDFSSLNLMDTLPLDEAQSAVDEWSDNVAEASGDEQWLQQLSYDDMSYYDFDEAPPKCDGEEGHDHWQRVIESAEVYEADVNALISAVKFGGMAIDEALSYRISPVTTGTLCEVMRRMDEPAGMGAPTMTMLGEDHESQLGDFIEEAATSSLAAVTVHPAVTQAAVLGASLPSASLARAIGSLFAQADTAKERKPSQEDEATRRNKPLFG